MNAFEPVKSVAASLPDADIDTDVIFPARFLLLTDKHGLGPYAFYEKRFFAGGAERPDFVLNQEPWRRAQILVAGANFGCGSSREQAPWSLVDLGLRCIIAPSFGEIFYGNCLNNGLLPIIVDAAQHQAAMVEARAGRRMTVDLKAARITLADGFEICFEIPEQQRQALLNGWDAIDLISHNQAEHIAAFEQAQRLRMPWLYADSSTPTN